MLKRFTHVLALACVGLGGCDRPAPTQSPVAAPLPIERQVAVPIGVRAMTQNMYVGADLDAVIGALASPDTGDDVPARLLAVQTLGATDYPARAGAFAREIARAHPDVVGLQEVSKIEIDLTALGLPTVVHLDFLAILLDSLAARGLHYAVAASVRNIVAQPVPGIELQDFDTMLVNPDRVKVSGAVARNYSSNLGVVAPGIDLERGYVVVQATMAGRLVAFASTHLESGDSPGIPDLRAAQAQELAAALPAGVPLLVMGDFNDTPGSAAYGVMAGAGLTDTWGALRRGAEGFTCCEAPDLGNRTPVLDQRIDYVWLRASLEGQDRGGNRVERVGARPSDRIPGPEHSIWPSDHAGLVFQTTNFR